MFVIRDELRRQSEFGFELAGDPCVFAGNDIGGAQNGNSAQGNVAEITNWRRHNMEAWIDMCCREFTCQHLSDRLTPGWAGGGRLVWKIAGCIA